MSLSWPRPTAPRDLPGRTAAWSVLLIAVLFAVMVTSAAIGSVSVPPEAVLKATLDAFAVPVPAAVGVGSADLAGVAVPVPTVEVAWYSPLSFEVSDAHRTIVVQLRLPRIVLGAAVGFSLATAGTVMQGFFRNPMADPSIVGVSSGGAVGAVAALVAPLSIPLGMPIAAFLGALGAAFGVYAVATEGGKTPVATLLLAGVAVQTFLGAVVSFMLVHSGNSLREAVFWLMGHLQWSDWGRVATLVPVALVCFVVLFAYARDLNLLLLGEADAAALGVEVERTKRLLLAVSSILTGAAVAVSGVIGFVGLIVPHGMRLVVGPDHRILLPTSALAGAAFLVATDTVARTTADLPVGIVTAFLGAPFFLFLLRKREVHEL